jgi:hypothetical protein
MWHRRFVDLTERCIEQKDHLRLALIVYRSVNLDELERSNSEQIAAKISNLGSHAGLDTAQQRGGPLSSGSDKLRRPDSNSDLLAGHQSECPTDVQILQQQLDAMSQLFSTTDESGDRNTPIEEQSARVWDDLVRVQGPVGISVRDTPRRSGSLNVVHTHFVLAHSNRC